MGGGSSDAATTLVALNEIWDLRRSVDELAGIGLELGADVPLFVRGRTAWGEGIGEILTPLELPESHFAIVFPGVGIGLLGVSLAFGLTVVTMAYAIGHISGCHLNPAVTVGLAAGGRCPAGQVVPYIVAQVVGAIVAAMVLYFIAVGAPGFDVAKGFASNGFGEHSPGKYGLASAFLTEVVMTMMFLFIIMGATHGKAPAGFAPLAIGLGLCLIHLVSIPVTNTSVNPARSTGPALFVGGWALQQLWLFWLAPIVGGVLGGVIYRWLSDEPEAQVTGVTPAPAE